LCALVGEDHEALVAVRSNLLVNQPLYLLRRQLRAVPDAQTLKPGDLLERVLDAIDLDLKGRLVGVRPVQVVPEELAEPALIDQR
jgi:hypothetical protein